MSSEVYVALLGFLVAVVGLLLLFIDRKDARTINVIQGVLDLAAALAAATPSTEDDVMIARLREKLGLEDKAAANTNASKPADELAKEVAVMVIDELAKRGQPAEPVTVIPPVDPAAVG